MHGVLACTGGVQTVLSVCIQWYWKLYCVMSDVCVELIHSPFPSDTMP